MKKKVLFPLLACSILTCGLIPCASASENTKGFAFTDKVVLTYYYIWFNEDKFLKVNPEESMKGLHPVVGAYNSWDPAIIEKHMQQMNRALIDALAVSWWYDTKENGMNSTLDTIFEKAKTHNLKITIDFEHGRAPLDEIYHDLFYFLNRYKNHPAMLKVEGHPVVMIWTA